MIMFLIMKAMVTHIALSIHDHRHLVIHRLGKGAELSTFSRQGLPITTNLTPT